MDFFGNVTEFLDEIIPEDTGFGTFFEGAIDILGTGLSESAKDGSLVPSGGSSVPSLSSGLGSTLGLSESIKSAERSSKDPLQSVNPREIQLQWFERLNSYSLEDM